MQLARQRHAQAELELMQRLADEAEGESRANQLERELEAVK